MTDEKRPGAGRPQGSTSRKPNKAKYLNIRCTEAEKIEITEKAKAAGLTITQLGLNALRRV
jgi:ribosomal protein L44E